MFKNVKTYLKSTILAVLMLAFTALTSCGGGGGSGGNEDSVGTIETEGPGWLIMYYCDADNDLEEVIMNDLNEMESIDLSAKKIKIVALVDRNASYYMGDGNWTGTRAYEITYDAGGYNHTLVSTRIAISDLGILASGTDVELNMGDGATLQNFIHYCDTNYDSTLQRMLLFTNHGGGWRDNPAAKKARLEKIGLTKAVCWDETSSDDCLYTSEVRTAISGAMGTTKLEIIAFDACLMGMVEIAYELKDLANYMLASEETIPGYGFPYTQILDTYEDGITSVQFGKVMANKYYDSYVNGTNVEEADFTDNTVTLSLIDLSKVSDLATAIGTFGTALNNVNDSNANMDKRIISETFEISDYVDIRHYCSNETLCTTERNAVTTAFDAAVIYNRAGAGNANAKGLSIFMPLRWTNTGEQPDYTSTNLLFVQDNPGWKTYLTSLTATTATDSNEIVESANGGVVPVAVPASGSVIETGYIYYYGDDDMYLVSGDGSFNLTVSGPAQGYVDYYIVNNSGYPEDYGYIYTGYTGTIFYNPSTQYVIVDACHYDEGYPNVSTINTYTLAFANN